MLGRSTRKDDGRGRRWGCRDRHQSHRNDAGCGGNRRRRDGCAVHMQSGFSIGKLVITVVGCIPIVMMLMRDMRSIAMRVGMDLDSRDIGQSEPQRQRNGRNKADRPAKQAVQTYTEEVQAHDGSMPQVEGRSQRTAPLCSFSSHNVYYVK